MFWINKNCRAYKNGFKKNSWPKTLKNETK